MATGTYAPDPDLRVVDANGVPIPGGLVWTYIAGTLTPTPTYTDVGLTVPNTNPIIAGSDGRFVAFLAGGLSYKFVYEMPAVPPAHGASLITRDNILAVTTIVPGSGGGVIQMMGLTGTVNDLPLLPGCSVLYCNNATPLTLTGLSGGVPGQRVTIIATGSIINLPYFSSASLAANRLLNWVSSAPTSIAAAAVSYGTATYLNDGTRWLLVAHEQNEWLDVPFNAANFTTNVGAWTVAAGNVPQNRYMLRGKTLLWQLAITTSSHPASNYLWPVIPGGFTIASVGSQRIAYCSVAGVVTDVDTISAGTNFLQLGAVSGAVLPVSAATALSFLVTISLS